VLCARCLGDLPSSPQLCVACQDYLCLACWEEFGHCGHTEVDRMNEELRASPASQHGAIMQRWLGGIEKPVIKPLRPRTH
jgi:hypothetical protein